MQLIADRYRLEESLGKGESGEVFRAWDTQTEGWVALKLMTHAGDSVAQARPLAEGEVIRQLRSAHIVPVFEMGVAADGRCFVAMQLVDGQPLAARFAAGSVPLGQLLTWGAQIAQALSDAHAVGLVHRNLRPANVMLETVPGESTPVARVLDFATGSPIAPEDAIGAPRYMPPEAWLGAHGPAGDLYQLGLILHEGVRGVPCFEGSPEALKRAHLQDPPPPLSGLDESVSGTIMRLLVKSARARPQSAAEVAATLRVLARTTSQAAQSMPTDGSHAPAAQSNMSSVAVKVWALTSLSLVLVLAGILISSRLGTWDLPGSRVADAPPMTFPQSTASGWILPPAAAAASAAAARKAAAQASSRAPRPSPAAPPSARLIVDPADATVRWGDAVCTASPCDVPTTFPIEARVERAQHESTTVRLTPGAVQRVRLAPIKGVAVP